LQAIANTLDFPRTLLTSSAGLEHAKHLVTAYKTGKIRDMTPELWTAKKIIDSTIHPGGRGVCVDSEAQC
jgi:sideroflexin-5